MSQVNDYIIVLILCLQTIIGCLGSTIGQYIYGFYLHNYPNSSNYTTTTTTNRSPLMNNQTNQCPNSEINPDDDVQQWAQQKSADLFFRTSLISSFPVIIMTYIIGLYISKFEKRFVVTLPMFGIICQFIIWLLVIYFHLSDFFWYLAAFIVGISGSGGVLGLALNLIITESTIESKRSSRFVRLNAMQAGVSAIATFAIGYYISWRGFTDLYWLGLSLQLLSMLMIILFGKSMNENSNERTPLLSSENSQLEENPSCDCKYFFRICTVLQSKKRSKKKSISLLLILFANIFYTLAATTLGPFLWFLLNEPFCWTSKDVGNYSALGAISCTILSVIGMKILTYVGASDSLICMISHFCFCAVSLWNAFAQHSWQLYVGLLIGAFSGYQSSLTLSMISKVLENHERSHAFTLVAEINTIIYTFGNSFFNWVYARTVVKYRNFTLLIAVGIGILPFILNTCLFLITRQMPDEETPTSIQTDVQNSIPSFVDDTTCVVVSPQTEEKRNSSSNDSHIRDRNVNI